LAPDASHPFNLRNASVGTSNDWMQRAGGLRHARITGQETRPDACCGQQHAGPKQAQFQTAVPLQLLRENNDCEILVVRSAVKLGADGYLVKVHRL